MATIASPQPSAKVPGTPPDSAVSKSGDIPELFEVQELRGHDDRVWSVSWSPDGALLASCSGDRCVRIWGREAGASSPFICKAILEDTHSRTIRSCEWSPDGRFLATASFDNTVAVWERTGSNDADFECLAVLEGHESEVKSVAWNATSSLLATCSRDKSVWIWEVPGGSSGVAGRIGVGPASDFDCVAVLHGHTQDVKMVRWHPRHDWLVSASYDDSIKVWAAEVEGEDDWSCVQTLDAANGAGHSSTVWAISFDATGHYMASCSDDLTVKIWDTSCEPSDVRASEGSSARGWSHVCTLAGFHDRTIFHVDWSIASGLIATAAGDDCIRVFSFPGLPRSEPGDDGTNSNIANRNGTGEEPGIAGEAGVAAAAAVGEEAENRAQLLIRKAHAHDTDVNCVRWNPKNPCLLASAGDDEMVKIWEIRGLAGAG
ncbi:hypothetical protein CLOP_g1624 [Closterium sp. NIES-67]|nr:hypothetical protein CLOP_g1624 [Closterium sp. NIES-67]